MSYILDALKKAESERERGVVPGLNSAQANHSTFIHYGSDQKPWWLVALVLGAVLAAVLAFWAWRQPAAGSPTTLAAQPVVPVAPAVALPVVPVPAQPQPQIQTPLPILEAKAPPAPVQKPELPLRAPASTPVAAPASPLQPAASTVAHVQAKVAPPPVSPVTPAVPVAAAPVEAVGKPTPAAAPIRTASGGIPMLNELPDALRRQIPALNISGAIYSDSPSEWTLIINDQIMGKGSQVAPDVRLEEISASSAVFNFRGQRFRMER